MRVGRRDLGIGQHLGKLFPEVLQQPLMVVEVLPRPAQAKIVDSHPRVQLALPFFRPLLTLGLLPGDDFQLSPHRLQQRPDGLEQARAARLPGPTLGRTRTQGAVAVQVQKIHARTHGHSIAVRWRKLGNRGGDGCVFCTGTLEPVVLCLALLQRLGQAGEADCPAHHLRHREEFGQRGVGEVAVGDHLEEDGRLFRPGGVPEDDATRPGGVERMLRGC